MPPNITKIVETAVARLVALSYPVEEARSFVQSYVDADDMKSLAEVVAPARTERLFVAEAGVSDEKNPVSTYWDWDKLGERVVYINLELTTMEKLRLIDYFPEVRLSFSANPEPHAHAESAARRRIETELCLSMVLQGTRDRAVIDLGGNDLYHKRKGRDWVHCECPVLSERDEARYALRDFYVGGTSSRCQSAFGDCEFKASCAIAIHSTYDYPLEELVVACARRGVKRMVGCMNVPVELPAAGRTVHQDGVVWEGVTGGGSEYLRMWFEDDPSEPYLHKRAVMEVYAKCTKFVFKVGDRQYLYTVESRRGQSIIFSIMDVTGMNVWFPKRVVPIKSRDYYYISMSLFGVEDLPVEKVLFDRLVLETMSEAVSSNFNVTSLFRWAKSLRQQIVVNGAFLSTGYTNSIDNLCYYVMAAYVVGMANYWEVPGLFKSFTYRIESSRSKGLFADVIYSAAKVWWETVKLLFDVATLGVAHVPGLLADVAECEKLSFVVSVREYKDASVRSSGESGFARSVVPATTKPVKSDPPSYKTAETSSEDVLFESDDDFLFPADSVSQVGLGLRRDGSEVRTADLPTGPFRRADGVVGSPVVGSDVVRVEEFLLAASAVGVATSVERSSAVLNDVYAVSQVDGSVAAAIEDALDTPVQSVVGIAKDPPSEDARDVFMSASGASRDGGLVEENLALNEFIDAEEKGRAKTANLWKHYGQFVDMFLKDKSYAESLSAVLDIEPDALKAVRCVGGEVVDLLTGDKVDASVVSTPRGLLNIASVSEGEVGLVNRHCRVYIYAGVIGVAQRALSAERYEAPGSVLVSAPAGAGKTVFITKNATHNDFVVAASRAAAKVLRRHCKHTVRYVTTAASLMVRLYNGSVKLPAAGVSTLYVDEALLLHRAVLVILLRLLRPRYILGYGDPKQILVQPYVSGVHYNYEKFPWESVSVLRWTRRMPADVCAMLKNDYGCLLDTFNPVVYSVKGPVLMAGYSASDFIGYADKGWVVMVFTNSFKKELRMAGCKNVFTVGECQGETFDDVILIREYERDMYLYLDERQAVVALSRHKRSLMYFTAAVVDKSSVARRIGGMDDDDVKAVRLLSDGPMSVGNNDAARDAAVARDKLVWADLDTADDDNDSAYWRPEGSEGGLLF